MHIVANKSLISDNLQLKMLFLVVFYQQLSIKPRREKTGENKDSTIPLLPNYKISSLVCVGPGRKPQRLVFSQRSSIVGAFLISGVTVLILNCSVRIYYQE